MYYIYVYIYIQFPSGFDEILSDSCKTNSNGDLCIKDDQYAANMLQNPQSTKGNQFIVSTGKLYIIGLLSFFSVSNVLLTSNKTQQSVLLAVLNKEVMDL